MRHYLSANERSETPSNLVVVSCEMDREPSGVNADRLILRRWFAELIRLEGNVPRSKVCVSGNTPYEFWRVIYKRQSKRSPLHIYTYNATHTMAALGLWEQLDSGAIRTHIGGDYPACEWYRSDKPFRGILCADGLPYIVRAMTEYGTLCIGDTLNYWHASIRDMATAVGVDDTPRDDDDGEQSKLDRCGAIRCDVISRNIIGLITRWKELDLGNWKPTAASLSMACFRHLVCDNRVPEVNGIKRYNLLIDTSHPSVPLEREAYRGGRVEAFFIGPINPPQPHWRVQPDEPPSGVQGPIYMLDIRSMYPRIMGQGEYPVERIDPPAQLATQTVTDLLRSYECVSEVLINSWTDTYPCKYEGRQVHASGRFWTVLCGDELRRAVASNHVESFGQQQWYRTAPIFTEWSEYLINLRTEATENGDRAMADLLKLLANSLHGKFGQKPGRWTFDPNAPVRRRWGRWHQLDSESDVSRTYRAIAGIVQVHEDQGEPEHTFPAIAACIAANAREWLRTLMCICPSRSCLYVATDALIVTGAGYDALMRRRTVRYVGVDRLAVKLLAEEGEIYGQGHYRIGDTEVVSGPWANAFQTGDGTWSTQLYSQAGAILERGPDTDVIVSRVPWSEPESLPKGVMGGDGWITPYQLIPTPECLQLTPYEQRRLLARRQA